eukprot:jgi/Botrbrau1/2631/Bobra.145_1s0049.1
MQGNVSDFAVAASQLPFLESLDVASITENGLTGELKETFCTSVKRNLTYIDVARNRIYGSVPSCFIGSGTLPQSIINATQLRVLSSQANSITGTLPHDMGTLPHMVTDHFRWGLHLLLMLESLTSATITSGCSTAKHCLSTAEKSLHACLQPRSFPAGSIPDVNSSRGLLPAILVLDAANNRLSGTIPRSLEGAAMFRSGEYFHVPETYTLNLQNNQLSGEIPDFFYEGRRPSFLEINLRVPCPIPTQSFTALQLNVKNNFK